MAINPTVAFGPLSGTIQLSSLDTNFNQLAAAINTFGSFTSSGNITTTPPTSITNTPAWVFQATTGVSPLLLSNAALDTIGLVNGYLQNDIYNGSNGSLASADWVATADTGSDSTHFIDMGINSSGFSSGAWTISGPLDAYVYAQDGVLTVGTAGAKSLIFHTGGLLAANIRGTISSAGNWTINAPSSGNPLAVSMSGGGGVALTAASGQAANLFIAGNGATTISQGLSIVHASSGAYIQTNTTDGLYIATNGTTRITVGSTGSIGLYGGASLWAQQAGWGTPVGGAAISSYNITDAGGANSNTNKAVAQIITALKALGIFAT